MRRRTIGLSLLMIGLVVGLLSIGSWAVFNDTETAGSYTATAGGLDLELDATQVVPAEISDLKPSDWHYLGPFELHNAGGNAGVLDLHFANIVDSGGDLTDPEEAAQYAGAIDDISNWIDVDWCVDAVLNGSRDCNGPIIGKLGELESQVIDLGVTLQPSDRVELWLSFHLETEAGNEYQGDQSTFDIEFTLHQANLGALGLPAGTACVRLENKDTTTWDPILGDALYGSVCYGVDGNGDLVVLLEASGLDDSKYYQIGMTGPDSCSDTDDQLASGTQQYPDFDSHFWVAGAPASTCTTVGFGFHNFAYEQPVGGMIQQTYTINNAGVPDPADSTDVVASHPALPSGVYTGVKFLVKEVPPGFPPPPWPATYTSVLMEMNTLSFNLP